MKSGKKILDLKLRTSYRVFSFLLNLQKKTRDFYPKKKLLRKSFASLHGKDKVTQKINFRDCCPFGIKKLSFIFKNTLRHH